MQEQPVSQPEKTGQPPEEHAELQRLTVEMAEPVKHREDRKQNLSPQGTQRYAEGRRKDKKNWL